jgi:hypothetical protein
MKLNTLVESDDHALLTGEEISIQHFIWVIFLFIPSPIWNIIDFQGHRSKVKVTGLIFLPNNILVNTPESRKDGR